jgi:hypothetical protein
MHHSTIRHSASNKLAVTSHIVDHPRVVLLARFLKVALCVFHCRALCECVHLVAALCGRYVLLRWPKAETGRTLSAGSGKPGVPGSSSRGFLSNSDARLSFTGTLHLGMHKLPCGGRDMLVTGLRLYAQWQ